jgi:hypothetical protein
MILAAEDQAILAGGDPLHAEWQAGGVARPAFQG